MPFPHAAAITSFTASTLPGTIAQMLLANTTNSLPETACVRDTMNCQTQPTQRSRAMWKRIKENAPAAAAIATVFVGFAAIVQLGVLNPIQQRIDDLQAGLNKRFEDQNSLISQRFEDQNSLISQRFEDQNSSINQRFEDQNSSISQRFEDQNSSINQRFDALDQRINDLQAGMNQRFEDQNRSINQRFDAMDGHIDRVSGDVSDLRKLSDRVSRNEGRIDAVTQQLQTADGPAP